MGNGDVQLSFCEGGHPQQLQGEFVCQSKVCNITVRVSLILTTVKNLQEQPPITKTVEEGKPFKLPCEAPDGWPKPNIYWMIQVRMMVRRRTEDDVVYVCFDGTEVHS